MYTSRTDQPFWDDPEFTESGSRRTDLKRNPNAEDEAYERLREEEDLDTNHA